jgi:hypothetical protein
MMVLLGFLALGLSGVPHFPAFKDFEEIEGSTSAFTVWSACIVVANAGIFFINVRGDYLSARSGFVPITCTFLALTTLFPVLVGAAHLASGDATLSLPPNVNWTYTAKIIFVGEGGLSVVLVISSLWKPSAPEAQEVMAMLYLARPNLRRQFGGGSPGLSQVEVGRLRELLDLLAEKSDKLIGRSLLPREREYIEHLAEHARNVKSGFEIPYAALRTLRPTGPLKVSVDYLMAEP